MYIEGITNGADLLSYLILLHLLWPSRSILYLLKGEEPIPYDLLITGKLQVDVLLHNKDPQNLVTDGHQGHQIKHLYCFYYAPEIEDQGAYCFCPVCHSVIL